MHEHDGQDKNIVSPPIVMLHAYLQYIVSQNWQTSHSFQSNYFENKFLIKLKQKCKNSKTFKYIS